VFENMRLSRWVLVATSFSLTPIRAFAQAEGTPVVPGLTLHIYEAVQPDTIVFQRSVTRVGQDSIAGTRTVVMHALFPANGAHLLEVEQRFPAGGGEIVDTAVDELHTLRAVAHRSHQPTRTMQFEFKGGNAVGTVVSKRSAGDSTVAVLQDVGGPIFDSNVIDLVVAALPLRAGFTVDLPFFIYERGGRVMMPVAVRDRATIPFAKLGQCDAWVVSVGVPGAPATVWVDTKTHAVLRVRYDITARNTSFTDERVTPLRA
jgi:hypothetical protein